MCIYIYRNNYSPPQIQLSRDKISKRFSLPSFFDLDLARGEKFIIEIRDHGIWIVVFFETFKNIVFRNNFLLPFSPRFFLQLAKFLLLPFLLSSLLAYLKKERKNRRPILSSETMILVSLPITNNENF